MTWLGLAPEDPFGLDNLPYGVAATDRGPRVVVRVGDRALDVHPVAERLAPELVPLLAGNLDPLMAAGPTRWAAVRAAVTGWLTAEATRSAVEPHLHAVAGLTLRLPFTVADYVDFYSSEHHAANVGRILRPGRPALPANWKHLPIGYHGRAGTVVVSGTDVRRPCGQLVSTGSTTGDGSTTGAGSATGAGSPGVVFGPTERLDLEAEVGYIVGVPSRLGEPVPLEAFADHVFGVCLVNDWSARDVQAWEYVPLGPFLAKSFATSVSAWVTPLAALHHARVSPPPRDPRPLPYLEDARVEPWGLDLHLEVQLAGRTISRPPYAAMYWTGAQQLAHMTVNGASVRTGDLFASGTVSGPEPEEWGSLIELTRGEGPFLADGDEVVITATAPGAGGTTIALGEVRGRIVPALAL